MQLGDGKRAVVITKWVNLGGGRHPSDPKWQRHIQSVFRIDKFAAPYPDDVGVSSSFEQQAGRTHAEISSDNAALLSGAA